MTPYGVLNGEVQQANIRKLQDGFRLCISCQHANIEPTAASFVVRCGDCYKKKEPSRFCCDCGEKLEASRIHYAQRNGGECRRCVYCSRGRDEHNPLNCPNCNVRHPDDWQCPSALPASNPVV